MDRQGHTTQLAGATAPQRAAGSMRTPWRSESAWTSPLACKASCGCRKRSEHSRVYGTDCAGCREGRCLRYAASVLTCKESSIAPSAARNIGTSLSWVTGYWLYDANLSEIRDMHRHKWIPDTKRTGGFGDCKMYPSFCMQNYYI